MSILNEKYEDNKKEESLLDLAFVMDSTGSMGSYIQNATNGIRAIVDEIFSFEKAHVRLALVEYRDHPPEDTTFVVRVHDFTESVKEMKSWLEECKADGGGDHPEAVADGLQAAHELTWRENATKVCVLISDAPPHGLGCRGDAFPDGCPDKIDILEVVGRMGEDGITLYSIGCEPAVSPYKEFFSALAYKTGGQYVPLSNASLLSKVIVYGTVEEISLEKLMDNAKKEFETQVKLGVKDEGVLADAIKNKLNLEGASAKQLVLNDSALEKASTFAIKYSKFSNLADLRKVFKTAKNTYNKTKYERKTFTKKADRTKVTTKEEKVEKKSEFVLNEADFPSINVPSKDSTLNSEFKSKDSDLLATSESKAKEEVKTEGFSIKSTEITSEQAERIVQKLLIRKDTSEDI